VISPLALWFLWYKTKRGKNISRNMSRVMWGVVTKESLTRAKVNNSEATEGKQHPLVKQQRQSLLTHFTTTAAPSMSHRHDNSSDPNYMSEVVEVEGTKRWRPREVNNAIDEVASTTRRGKNPATSSSIIMPDDGILFGPSGGGNRETQNRRRLVMPALATTAASPYSRENIAAVRQARHVDGERSSHVGRSSTTEFDEALLEPFLPPPGDGECPRSLFRGRCFFLNSCDADPQITVYLLEKLIRRLGGVTSMSVSGVVSYVVTQHLSSAKEIKLLKRSGGGRGRHSADSRPKYIHPHWILACAKSGRIVAEGPFMTVGVALSAASTNIANVTSSSCPSSSDCIQCEEERGKPPTSTAETTKRRVSWCGQSKSVEVVVID
jgi:hypothetical protein